MTKTENLSLPQLQFSDTLYDTVPAGMNAPPAALQAAAGDDFADSAEALAALAAAVGTSGHTCRIATGSYVGTGTYGNNVPIRLTFDGIHPLMVIVAHTDATVNASSVMFMRPAIRCKIPGYNFATVAWGDNFVEYYSDNDVYTHLNVQNYQFCYTVFGWDLPEAGQ